MGECSEVARQPQKGSGQDVYGEADRDEAAAPVSGQLRMNKTRNMDVFY